MAVLSWFPYDVDAWETRVRELRLSFEQEGILLRLYRGAWRAAQPCTIVDDEDEFARILGAHWQKAIPVLREHFTPVDGSPGLLRSEWLHALYLVQFEKHLSYQRRGGLGGRPRKQPESSAESSANSNKAQLSDSKPELPNKEAGVLAQLSQNSTEGISSAPPSSEHRANAPATAGALAPGGAAPRATVAAARVPYVAAVENRPLDEYQDAERKREVAYFARLRGSVHRWTQEHPETAAAIDREVRQKAGLPTGELTPGRARTYGSLYAEAVRERNHWPTIEHWNPKKPDMATPKPTADLTAQATLAGVG